MKTFAPRPLLLDFLRNETGAVTGNWVVLTAALVGLGLETVAVATTGVEDGSNDIAEALSDGNHIYLAANFGRTPEEVLANTTSLNARQISNRLDKFLNERSETQVRSAVRNWENIAANPDHKNHAKAEDQLKILNVVMDVRGMAN